MTAARAIIHVDMDAFYAAIEQRDNPQWRGRPLVVGELGPRSVVSTASYEARPFGVRSAMPTLTAKRLCPEAIFVPVRMSRYQEVSAQVFEVFAEVTPQIEGLSLDEAFLDVTGSLRLFGGQVEAIGRFIKAQIRARTALNASVGMAHNKLLAKLASELSKPDGLLRITQDSVQSILDPLPVGRLWTIGKVAEAGLHRLGIRTVRDLREADARRLAQAMGNQAVHWQRLARGLDDRPVEAGEEKSVSAETTFETDLDTLDQALAWLARLAERVGERVRAHGLQGRTVTVKLRKPPFETHTRQVTLVEPSDVTAVILDAGRTLLRRWWQGETTPRLRLLGIGLSSFGELPQSSLFDNAAGRAQDHVADRINRKFGGGSLVRGAVLKARKPRDDESS
ncbi:DNA polymerase IV [Tahibacter amnicola]|uniref:DNA polymerase IV n=1 Tax=Tahibacter amnicola TaxID=2976241 RepID=A0ABY6BJR1_9GAMM|nr:DNA polymerase IV [Tahibacter amnicola]UXI70007.1 DNA polymerase IV [Tahibacter amnicola]